MNKDLSTSKNYSFFNTVKGFIQIHVIAKDRGFKYEKIADTPDFNGESAALKYWEANKERLIDTNFYNDEIVIVRKEIHNTCIKRLN